MKRYVLIGASYRTLFMFARPLVSEFDEFVELVGVFDINPLRTEALKNAVGTSCRSYSDLDLMLAETQPDSAIIATMDSTHHEYIIRCLEAGLNVITEKPMTVDAPKCRDILEAERRTGQKVSVTFNVRFTPYAVAVKELISDGAIGRILNVNYEYILDTSHGADYFRRWHRKKENSGGLLVHKSTHHFDLVNWWIEEEPVDVMAYGTRRFYGPTRIEHGERCLTCGFKNSCEYFFDLKAEPLMKSMYADAEGVDGYYRDTCVFSEEIDIEDTMSVNVRYSGGTLLNYSLITHAPYEGYKVSLNGTKGRMEVAEYYSGMHVDDPFYYIDIYDRKGQMTRKTLPKPTGSHGGGDDRLRMMLFRDDMPDPLGQQAGSYAGAISVLIGAAANKSILEGRNVRINDLLPLDLYRESGYEIVVREAAKV